MTLHSAQAPADGEVRKQVGEVRAESYWLVEARNAFDASTTYYDSEMRKQVEKAVSNFHSRHPSGSKYHSSAYKFRSKMFRPKTRSVIRRNEAAAATALFSTPDVVDIQPELEGDEKQQVSAEILRELMGYRLEKSIKWFMTAIGAYQDALVAGVVISHQYWDYEERQVPMGPAIDQETGMEIIDVETGEPIMQYQRELLRDQPCVEIRPIENIRFSPSANWLDPLNDSPYVIDRFPMHIGDIKLRMKMGAKAPWYELTDGQLAQGASNIEGNKGRGRDRTTTNKEDVKHNVSDFDVAWIHRNIIRKDGQDWIFYTLGTIAMLSDPIPLEAEYYHLQPGTRPYVMGNAILETHRAYPSGLSELMAPLQQEANEVNNQRRDNVSLALNRRYLARRGANIDFRSLTRNVPGSVTMTDDINKDIRSETVPDVTGSSYQEQDRINMDYDELAGSFSSSSVATNRNLNETVGGMTMMSDGANAIVEYQLRTFVETWAEPVLRQVAQMIQANETDEKILMIAGQNAGVMQRYGFDKITDEMLQGSMTIRLNVGFGATSPQKRLEKLSIGLRTVGEIVPNALATANSQEIIKEVFGALGYKSSERFFPAEDGQDPQVAQLMQQLQQAQQMLEGKQMEQQAKNQVEMARLQVQQQKNAVEAEIQQARLAQERELKMMEMALKWDISMADLHSKLQIEAQNTHMRQIDAAQKAEASKMQTSLKLMEENTKRIAAQNNVDELNYKMRTGNEGI